VRVTAQPIDTRVGIHAGFWAYVQGRAGQSAGARASLESARLATANRYEPPSTFAFGYIGLGEWEAAVEWLGRTVEECDPSIMPIPSFHFPDPVRRDVRYGRCWAG